MAKKPYNREHAKAILKAAAILDADGKDRWRLEENGLWPDTEHDWFVSHGLNQEYEEQSWVPAVALVGTDSEVDLASTPALPFPFDERDLAAFMLSGLGYFLAEFYGGLGYEIDEHALNRIDPAQNYARRAVRGAFAAYREAVERVGQPDRALAARMHEAHEAYRKARTDAMQRHSLSAVPQAMAGDSDERRRELDVEYRRRLALVEGEVSALGTEAKLLQNESESAQQTWLRAMVTELLKAATDTATEPQPAPAMEPAPRPPKVAVVPFTKAALIAAHKYEWPTIDRDIADAKANGLAAAAKAGKRGWLEAEALEWARAKGKLATAAKPADSLAQAMHNLGSLPSRTYTPMQG